TPASTTARVVFSNPDGIPVTVNAEIADNAFTMAKGLMFRKSLDGNAGMLFVFPNADYHGFWMMNTTIPLDAIFIAEDGRVVDIIGMDPCSNILGCHTYKPKETAIYVLEVNQGFSVANSIERGKSRLVIE
ncbi:DUF192 domain-containing protein, partial [Candidatus Micrarchaeota archaeon]|nr:DUF192 domain-containing protein [Candidatus Micrarchaeota archaeon]